MSQMRVDHIIYAVDDLEAAGRQLYEESGLASIEGGRHPAWGTANRIVPLGTAYLELITVVDRDVAAFSDFGRPVMDAIAAGRHLVGWVVATDDIDAISRRLGLDVSRGARTRPDGTRLSWQLAGVARALTTGALPIFIEWGGSADLHPGKAQADHRLVPTGSPGSRSSETSMRCALGWAISTSSCGSSTVRRGSPRSRSVPARTRSCFDRPAAKRACPLLQ